MVRCAQLVIGPAGSGKSTYCKYLQTHGYTCKRTFHIVNLDPAAETFYYEVAIDIRELIPLEDVMEEIQLGPNGALIYCMEYLIDHIEWLVDELSSYSDDDYLIFDCPGQIELYSHIPVMSRFCQELQRHGFLIAGVYVLDSQFLEVPSKFISGSLSCLSAMLSLELPHVNLLSKWDKIHNKREMQRLLEMSAADLVRELHQDTNPKFERLNNAMGHLLDDYSMVSFIPLDISDPETISLVAQQIDNAIGWDEQVEAREPQETEQGFDNEDKLDEWLNEMSMSKTNEC